jgi:hypothetical protein
MEDLAVRPAHGGKAVALLENPGKLRIDMAFVVALVRDHLLLNHLVGLRDQRRAVLWRGVVERIDDRSEPVEVADQRDVVAMQLASRRGGHTLSGVTVGGAQSAECIEDHGDIDHLLSTINSAIDFSPVSHFCN